nr:MAG TPA: hypothetical protein [Caudoviricetes sp.]
MQWSTSISGRSFWPSWPPFSPRLVLCRGVIP